MTPPVKLAILANSLPPYRLQVHLRIAREVPEVKLYTVMTHEEDARWAFDPPSEINVVSFGRGESCALQSSIRRAAHEWRKGGRIIRWMRREGIGAAIVSGYNDPARLRVMRWCHRHGVAVFISGDSNIRDDVATGVRSWLKHAILRRVLRWTDGALPFGTLGRQYFERYGILPGRIFYFPMEPDYDLITSLDPRIVARVADEFRLSPGRRRLLFSGRLLRMKRVDLLIDAFASIVQLRPKWDLILLGDGDLRGALEARVPPEHAQRFRFLGHAPAPATVAALCRACDVLVLPSEQERWALVINEAAAAGMAIVSSEVPGAVADLVVDGVNGRVFPRNDLDALRACLLDVTAEGRTDQLRASSRLILETWRGLADPVQGLRAALSSVRRAREMPAST